MKLEKREITLNEFDSLKDAYYIQKNLLEEYVDALPHTQRRQTRNRLMDLIKESAADLLYLCDLIKEKKPFFEKEKA